MSKTQQELPDRDSLGIESLLYEDVAGTLLRAKPIFKQISAKPLKTFKELRALPEKDLIVYGTNVSFCTPAFEGKVIPAFTQLRPFMERAHDCLVTLVEHDFESALLNQMVAWHKPKVRNATFKQRQKEYKFILAYTAVSMSTYAQMFAETLAERLRENYQTLEQNKKRLQEINSTAQLTITPPDITFHLDEAYAEFMSDAGVSQSVRAYPHPFRGASRRHRK